MVLQTNVHLQFWTYLLDVLVNKKCGSSRAVMAVSDDICYFAFQCSQLTLLLAFLGKCPIGLVASVLSIKTDQI